MLEHRRGWSISPQAGKAKLTRRHPNGTRSSATLAIHWTARSGSAINAEIERLRLLMEERGLGLAKAHALMCASNTNTGPASRINWQLVTNQFLESRADRRASTLGNLRYRVGNVLKTLEARQQGTALQRLVEVKAVKSVRAGTEATSRDSQEHNRTTRSVMTPV